MAGLVSRCVHSLHQVGQVLVCFEGHEVVPIQGCKDGWFLRRWGFGRETGCHPVGEVTSRKVRLLGRSGLHAPRHCRSRPNLHPKGEDLPPGGGAVENSSASPGCVCRSRIVPDGSSSTECARRQADSRHGGTELTSFLI